MLASVQPLGARPAPTGYPLRPQNEASLAEHHVDGFATTRMIGVGTHATKARTPPPLRAIVASTGRSGSAERGPVDRGGRQGRTVRRVVGRAAAGREYDDDHERQSFHGLAATGHDQSSHRLAAATKAPPWRRAFKSRHLLSRGRVGRGSRPDIVVHGAVDGADAGPEAHRFVYRARMTAASSGTTSSLVGMRFASRNRASHPTFQRLILPGPVTTTARICRRSRGVVVQHRCGVSALGTVSAAASAAPDHARP